MIKNEILKQALQALDGGHINRAYGYIQAALAQPKGHTMIAHGHKFDCKFDYEPAEPAWGDDPAWPATYTLISAIYEGIEVLPILDPAIVHTLEEQRRTE